MKVRYIKENHAGQAQTLGKVYDISIDEEGREFFIDDEGERNYNYFWRGHCFEVIQEENKSEQVHSPKHYNVLEDIEAIQIIASSMTQEMFKGYCLGNILKYRLRCGAKDDVSQELAKADKYKELFAKYNHMCKGEK